MEAKRISRAVDRIGAALDRIERVAKDGPTSPPQSNAELVARHEALREAVNTNIAKLDTLIGRLET